MRGGLLTSQQCVWRPGLGRAGLAWAATAGAWTADTPAVRNSVLTAVSSYNTIPKAFPFPCSQQVSLVALTQSCGQDLPSPCLLPTATIQGLALKVGMFSSTVENWEHPSHSAFYCSHSLQAMFPPNRARSAVFRKAHGLAKPGLGKGSVGALIPEVRKPPNHLLHS